MEKPVSANKKTQKSFNKRPREKKEKSSGIKDLFGLLKGKIKEDPVVIQRRMRDE
jgi:hypothetical protein